MVKSAALFALACCFAASVFVLEHTRVAAGAAPILKIEAVSPDSSSTGTLHYVDELRLSVGSSAPLIFKSELNGKLIPVPGPQYPIDDAHVLLLGWSSSGSGMQTIHALLLHVENDQVSLQRQLTLTTERAASALLVRRNGPNATRLGVGEPIGALHDENEWLLVFGPARDERLDIEQIRKLRFVAEDKKDSDVLYAPPSHGARFPPRIAWLSVSTSGFSLLTEAR